MTIKFTRGFTLAEVLIALALLGVLAAFAIPKVLQSTADVKRISMLKETYANLADLTYSGVMDGQLNGATLPTYFLSRFNCLKSCPTNSSTELCWNAGTQGSYAFEITGPGCILKNGVVIVGLDNVGTTQGCNGVLVDFNGVQGSNTIGEDQLYLNMRFTNNPLNAAQDAVACESNQKVGGILAVNCPANPMSAAQTTSNNQLFGRITQ